MRKLVDIKTGRILGYALIIAIIVGGVGAMIPLSKIVGGGRLIYAGNTEESPGTVIFKHYTHVEKSGYKCTACHYNLFGATQYSTKVTMEGIFSGEWCGACHDGDKAFGADECEKCHVERKFWLIKNII